MAAREGQHGFDLVENTYELIKNEKEKQTSDRFAFEAEATPVVVAPVKSGKELRKAASSYARQSGFLTRITQQVETFKPIVKAIHENGGIFFCQIWHALLKHRFSHKLFNSRFRLGFTDSNVNPTSSHGTTWSRPQSGQIHNTSTLLVTLQGIASDVQGMWEPHRLPQNGSLKSLAGIQKGKSHETSGRDGHRVSSVEASNQTQGLKGVNSTGNDEK
nr:putative 12-oxophytodienoate reductase 11 [Tanacetum cinerariifolium]